MSTFRTIAPAQDSAWHADLWDLIHATAKGAGNSPEMIRRYYRKALSQVGKVAVQWFAVAPSQFRGLLKTYLTAKSKSLSSSISVAL